MLKIFIDADDCPVNEEVDRLAGRYGLEVAPVANSSMRVPGDGKIEMIVVDGKFDAADDWIVEHAGAADVVITADIPLASRHLNKKAMVLRPTGRELTEGSTGDALATRDLHVAPARPWDSDGGPAPFENKDRSRFLHRLDQIVQTIRTKIGPHSTEEYPPIGE